MSGRQILVWRPLACQKNTAKAYMTIVVHYRAISNMVSHLEVAEGRKRINPAKQKDALTSFLILRVEAKIFQYCFLEEHKVCVCVWELQYLALSSKQNHWILAYLVLLLTLFFLDGHLKATVSSCIHQYRKQKIVIVLQLISHHFSAPHCQVHWEVGYLRTFAPILFLLHPYCARESHATSCQVMHRARVLSTKMNKW